MSIAFVGWKRGLSLAVLVPSLVMCSASVARAQGAPAGQTAKPGGKSDKKAADKKAAEEKAAADKAAADKEAADKAEKEAADKAAAEKAAADKAAAEESAAQKRDPSTVEPPREEWDIYDVAENPAKTYIFVGARYRGMIVPKFMLNLFVDEGKTIYSNTIGLELDLRKDGFSLIPALSFTEYGTGDILFKEKDSPDIAGNYNLVNSSMKAIYATADLLWSTKISKNVDFEYGAGFGLGVVFGNLVTNWVQEDPNGNLQSETGKRFSPCVAVGAPGTGCNKADHKNSDIDRVNNYDEPSWFNGGSKPVFFPWLAVPQLGVRFKPMKQFVARFGVGFSLTGFWFGLSGNYGLEKKPTP